MISISLCVTAGLWSSGHAAQSGGAQPAAAANKTVWDGVFTAAQASSGQAVYAKYCVECHIENLSGGGQNPQLAGAKWLENWREDNLESLFLKIRNTMPRRRTVSLTDQEALDVMTYILQRNDFPEGPALQRDSLAQIQIQRKDGPRPLPNYAQVEIVGCMTKEGTNWALTRVDKLRRLRGAGAPDPDTVNRAASSVLGSGTFPLDNLIILGGFDPAPHEGHKMLARGALIRRANAERISVASLDMVGEKCAGTE
jgi:mono/diheme cytochrome c family protein